MKGLLSIPVLIGNREHKHTRYNKPEKTTDSRKTLTGCGLFSFLQKKYIVPQQVRKMGKGHNLVLHNKAGKSDFFR